MQIIDARGKACPQPVVMARNAMQQADELTVLVSAQDALNNVRHLAEKAGWKVQVEQREGGYALSLQKGSKAVEPVITPEMEEVCTLPARSVVVVSGEEMGRGNAELGVILMRSFFYALTEVEIKPRSILFLNTGVRLTVADSPVLEALQKLVSQGVEILICGTCLGYFNLKEQVAVGQVSNMYTIAEKLLAAGHTVTI
ncbi:MAG: sulfurtransferase-like selenium metabolism protein YedF [Anaerolineae bacterium]